MVFYFINHFLLGLLGISTIATYFQAKQNPLSSPKWVSGDIGNIFAWVGFFAPIAALITTLLKFGFFWMLLTAGELFLGAFIGMMMSSSLKTIAAMICPFASIAIVGGLWKFWHFG